MAPVQNESRFFFRSSAAARARTLNDGITNAEDFEELEIALDTPLDRGTLENLDGRESSDRARSFAVKRNFGPSPDPENVRIDEFLSLSLSLLGSFRLKRWIRVTIVCPVATFVAFVPENARKRSNRDDRWRIRTKSRM